MKGEKISFRSGGNKSVGVLYSSGSTEKFPIAIFCHGYRGTKESSKVKPLAEKLISKGVGLFAFDFSGRGESEGKFEETTISQYIEDLASVINHLSKYTDKISVIGSSLGGLVTLQEAVGDKKIKLLVLLSPVSHFPWRSEKEFSEGGLKEWKERGYTYMQSGRFGELKINYSFYEDGLKFGDYSVYESIDIPVLVIHGTEDESVPIDDSRKLVKYIQKSNLIELTGADHMYTGEKNFDRVVEETVRFIVGNL
ncbi:MAG: alpha/beta hydrolase [Candidatus Woesearchaeota archaeon]